MDKNNTSTILRPTSYINLSKAKVNKRVAKNRFNFELDCVESIQWLYKISYDTVGIKDSDEFKEYQIFEVEFKEKIAKDILIKIQATIPYPILFKVVCGCERCYMFCQGKIVLETNINLIDDDTLNIEASSIAKLVFNTVVVMAEVQPKQDENLDNYISRYQQIKKLNKDLESFQRQMNNEKQPKKRIEINVKFKEKEKELVELYD